MSRRTDDCKHRAMIASTVAENVSTASPIESVNLSRKRPMIARKPADDCKRLHLSIAYWAAYFLAFSQSRKRPLRNTLDRPNTNQASRTALIRRTESRTVVEK